MASRLIPACLASVAPDALVYVVWHVLSVDDVALLSSSCYLDNQREEGC